MRHLKLFESFDDSDQNYHFPNEFIIDGVDEVFREYPELEGIGTKQAYSRYLETVFPDSKIKDIVYHSSPSKFSKFKDPASSGLSHIWFSEKPLEGQFGSNIYSVLLDLQNPLTEDNPDYRRELEFFEVPLNPDWANNYHKTGELPRFKYDGTIRLSRVDGGKSITVRNPEQIHILGSEEDIEGFIQYSKKG
jgi:hypothetical protein